MKKSCNIMAENILAHISEIFSSKYEICAGTQQIIFNKFKRPCFWPIFGSFSKFLGQKIFSQKIWLCHTQLHMGF